MTQRLRMWIKQNRRRALLSLAAVIAAFLLIWGGYAAPWTGFRGKTLWEWLQLLIIPLVLAGAALWFNWQQSKVEGKIAQDQQRENMLQEYLNRMSELLLDKKLRNSEEGADIRQVARARTLAVLLRLNSERQRTLLRFLAESGLLSKPHPIIMLREADLSHTDLTYASLSNTNLNGIILRGAILRDSVLQGTNLEGSQLDGVDLRGAHMAYADLSSARLKGANLRGAFMQATMLIEADLTEADLTDAALDLADLTSADLTRAKVTSEQLAKAKSLKGATLPDGTKHY